ncbi:hypothetical protein BaRGS_00005501 [Batillaria attramentaria]|uniref:Uncharacterized protein n=1 Tax=Batillaria attramentaria TaxID=370345 RepID=A0ABD0LVW6_9CAEN
MVLILFLFTEQEHYWVAKHLGDDENKSRFPIFPNSLQTQEARFRVSNDFESQTRVLPQPRFDDPAHAQNLQTDRRQVVYNHPLRSTAQQPDMESPCRHLNGPYQPHDRALLSASHRQGESGRPDGRDIEWFLMKLFQWNYRNRLSQPHSASLRNPAFGQEIVWSA